MPKIIDSFTQNTETRMALRSNRAFTPGHTWTLVELDPHKVSGPERTHTMQLNGAFHFSCTLSEGEGFMRRIRAR